MHVYRTHNCGALRQADVGAHARLSGWVHRVRNHGGLLFIDLRDHYGVTQCVVEPDSSCFEECSQARSEWVLTLTGPVVARSVDTANPELPTGDVEIRIEQVAVQSRSEELPFPIFGDLDYPEETRLRYRFLDLRREGLHRNIVLRSEVIQSIRKRMIAQGFVEFQTPILTASSPEGARDFLVPSRLHPGKFYALPQAPQQFKQLIMVAGFDRYFQIAPCFRDEDARADRSPGEFYQLDVEMSFVTQEDVFAAMEPVLGGVFEEFAKGRTVSAAPFPRIPYAQSMALYGTDKPDLRNPLMIADVKDIFDRDDVTFRAFKNKDAVRAIPAPGAAAQPRSWFDKLNEWARTEGAPGLGYIVYEDKGGALVGKGPIAKFLSTEALNELAMKCAAKAGDAVFFAADKEQHASRLAGLARIKIGRELKLVRENSFEFCWIVDYPMYEWNEQEKKIDFSHNPFSMPQGGMEALEKEDPLAILAYQYDIVCNGTELSSGAIRNHRPEIMLKAFEIAGYTRAETEARFSGLLNAFRYGAPPHGGTAPGIDRIVMLIAGEENLREVTMFPMNQQAEDVMMGAPSAIDSKHLRELHIRTVAPEKKD